MITLIAQSDRTGTVVSPPVWVPFGSKTVCITATMNPLDVTTAGNVLSVAILWTVNGVTFSHAASCTWKSGLYSKPKGGYDYSGPGMTINIPPGIIGFAGQIISPRLLDVGLSIAILDAAGNDLPLAAPSGSGVPVDVPVYPTL